MSVLLLRLAAPLQSWGDSSRFVRRATRHEPTKSGVVGLLAAALGRSREDRIDDLAQLEMGVRVDQKGRMLSDFQTERSLDGKKVMPLSRRYYLSDACFLVVLSGSADLLNVLDAALRKPAYPLYLGRRSCPPSLPLTLGVKGYARVRDALEREPWLASELYRRRHDMREPLEIICDAAEGEAGFVQHDYPLSFSDSGRRYADRRVARAFIPNPSAPKDEAPHLDGRAEAGHDPMSLL